MHIGGVKVNFGFLVNLSLDKLPINFAISFNDELQGSSMSKNKYYVN